MVPHVHKFLIEEILREKSAGSSGKVDFIKAVALSDYSMWYGRRSFPEQVIFLILDRYPLFSSDEKRANGREGFPSSSQ